MICFLLMFTQYKTEQPLNVGVNCVEEGQLNRRGNSIFHRKICEDFGRPALIHDKEVLKMIDEKFVHYYCPHDTKPKSHSKQGVIVWRKVNLTGEEFPYFAVKSLKTLEGLQ